MFGFFLFAMLSVVISVLTLVGLATYKFVHASFTEASENEYFTDSVWDEENLSTNIAIVYMSDYSEDAEIKKMFLFRADDKTNKYYIYDFPVHEEIQIPAKDNTVIKTTLSELNRYSNDNNDQLVSNIKNFYVNYLAIKVDGYILIDEKSYSNLENIYEGIDYNDLAVNLRLKNTIKVPQSIMTFRNDVKTNMSFNDTVAILRFLKNTSGNSSVYHSVSKFELLDLEQWDRLWQESMQYVEVKKEGIKIFVLNASNDPKIPGLAGWGNRLAKNMGAGVLGAENSFTDFSENTIIAEDENLMSVKLLKDTLQINDIVRVSDLPVSGEYNPEIFRTKVTLVLVDY